jgi:hypothetical protein
MSAPTPAEVDKKAAQYYALKDALDEANTEAAKLRCLPLAKFKEELIEVVSKFGSSHAGSVDVLRGWLPY